MLKEVLILSTTPAGIQAAFDLADFGLQVHLVEAGPFIGEIAKSSDYACFDDTRLLELLKHPGIKVWTNSEVTKLEEASNGFHVELVQSPRYIDLEKCTACGDCLEVCPVSIPGSELKAIFFSGQPDCATIAKAGVSPCSYACPAGIHVQGYVALVSHGRYREAYELINDALPFPSVCGRVCNHPCEIACSRSQLDLAVNIMGLKHFLADWAFDHLTDDDHPRTFERQPTGKNIAIIGAGPAGLTAARDLIRNGHQVKVFDENPEPGGMMRLGIPPHRVSSEQLNWEIEKIISEGIEMDLNTRVDDIPGLLDGGYDAVLAAAGAGAAIKPDVKNSDHHDNWLSLDFLKRVCLGKGDDLTGRRVIVLGGGDVALDAARSALRLGVAEVKILCRGIRASDHELQAAIEEGIEIIKGRVFKEICLTGKKIEGVLCLEAEVGEVVNGKRQFKELQGTEHLIRGDLVIWALGQKIDRSFLPEQTDKPGGEQFEILTDERMMTTVPGLFAAGDFRLGHTSFVVDAVGEGHRAARSIHNYLMDQSINTNPECNQVMLSLQEMEYRIETVEKTRQPRKSISRVPVQDRINNFQLVDQSLSEKNAQREAGRCLACGPCSECMACVEVCEPGAVILNQQAATERFMADAVIAESDFAIPDILDGLILVDTSDPLAGSAAAFQVMQRDKLVFPSETAGAKIIIPDISTGHKGTGVIVCQCGGEISTLIDTAAICQDLLSWSEIDFTAELPYSCTEGGSAEVQRLIQENDLDKIVLAACSCCSLDQVCLSCTYQRVRCKDNLGIYNSVDGSVQVEFVNLREQCAWAHPRNMKKTTAAAKVLIHSALARNPGMIRSKFEPSWIPASVLILGKGASAKYCHDALNMLELRSEIVEVSGGDIIRFGGKFQAEWPGINYQADCLVLAPGSRAELDHLMKSLFLSNQQPLLADRNLSQDTVDFGLVISPPELEPEVSGRGAAARLIAWIRRMSARTNQPAAAVDPLRCRTCGTCQEICGYGIPRLIETGEFKSAFINPLLCLDCGTCTAHCPSGAISPGAMSELELEQMLVNILG